MKKQLISALIPAYNEEEFDQNLKTMIMRY